MLSHFWKRISGGRSRPNNTKIRAGRTWLSLEPLGERVLPAVTASFIPGAGLLTILGDAQNNTITVSRDAAGAILVNGGAVQVRGGTATVANTARIQVFGLSGNDQITFD